LAQAVCMSSRFPIHQTQHAAAMAGYASNDAMGILFMVVSEMLLALVNAMVKFVKSWPAQRIMAFRSTVDLVLCLAMCAALGLSRPNLQASLRLCMRGVAYVAFIGCLWAGLRSCLPLGDIVVLVVAVSPLFLVVLTRLLLGERIPPLWPLQLTLCAIGAVLINKPLAPDSSCSASTALYPIGAAFFGAMMNFMSRKLKDQPPPVVMVFNDIAALVLTFGIALATEEGSMSGLFVPTELDVNTFLVCIAALLGWVGLMSNVVGYQSVSVAAVASIAGYASVPMGYLLQVVVFGQMPDIMSVAGALLILVTNVVASVARIYAAPAEVPDAKDYKPLPEEDVADSKLGA